MSIMIIIIIIMMMIMMMMPLCQCVSATLIRHQAGSGLGGWVAPILSSNKHNKHNRKA